MWSPFDYAARGDLCPLEDTRAYVAQIRTRLGVPLLVLLPATSRSTVPSLALASGKTAKLEAAAVAWLQDYLRESVNVGMIVKLAFREPRAVKSTATELPRLPAWVHATLAQVCTENLSAHAVRWPIGMTRAHVRPLMIGYSTC